MVRFLLKGLLFIVFAIGAYQVAVWARALLPIPPFLGWLSLLLGLGIIFQTSVIHWLGRAHDDVIKEIESNFSAFYRARETLAVSYGAGLYLSQLLDHDVLPSSVLFNWCFDTYSALFDRLGEARAQEYGWIKSSTDIPTELDHQKEWVRGRLDRLSALTKWYKEEIDRNLQSITGVESTALKT